MKIIISALALLASTSFAADIPTPVNGVCGSANGTTVSVAPTANLCSVGSPSVVNPGAAFSWFCFGVGAGTNASCTTIAPPDPAIQQAADDLAAVKKGGKVDITITIPVAAYIRVAKALGTDKRNATLAEIQQIMRKALLDPVKQKEEADADAEWKAKRPAVTPITLP